tara:strand:+ start:731 stop:967 length:237 start_codon:yes stop_codon:yes gene_type:complete
MYGVNAKLPKADFKCHMCHSFKNQDVYIWGNFQILPKHPYQEYRICKKCAVREHGSKRVKLETIIDERTKQWLEKQKQ